MPFSLPVGSSVASAVVAGSKTVGWISLIQLSSTQVRETDPDGKAENGVSLCGINGPIPHISGLNSSMNLSSCASIFLVW